MKANRILLALLLALACCAAPACGPDVDHCAPLAPEVEDHDDDEDCDPPRSDCRPVDHPSWPPPLDSIPCPVLPR